MLRGFDIGKNYTKLQNGGSYVLAVDAGREAILSVWQWQWGHLLGKVAVSNSRLFHSFMMDKPSLCTHRSFVADYAGGLDGGSFPSPRR